MFCDLTGKIAVITGASSGIGEATSYELSKLGASVVIAARRKEKLDAIATALTSQGGKVLSVATDVGKKEEVDNLISQAVATFGKIDILVNNAGIAHFVPFLEMTEAQWDETLDINLKGYFLTAQACVREMKKNSYGRIVNVASIAMGGVGIGFPAIAHYCASKGGIVALSEALAVELAPFGILVNAIAPGVIETEMTQGLLSDEKSKEGLFARIPLKRAGKSQEIAHSIAFLSSDEASYVTGATLIVDGGYLAG